MYCFIGIKDSILLRFQVPPKELQIFYNLKKKKKTLLVGPFYRNLKANAKFCIEFKGSRIIKTMFKKRTLEQWNRIE